MFEKARRIQRRHQANGEGGFTLIELLIVIVVLGILAAIVVFALGGVTGQSAIAACTSDAKTVSIAVSAFEANNPGVIPTSPTFNAAGTAVASATGSQSNLVTGDANGVTYLKSWPTNPSYYVIGLDASGNVVISLNKTDSGASGIVSGATGVGTAQLSGITATTFSLPAEYEGTTVFNYPTGNTLAGQGVCQGA